MSNSNQPDALRLADWIEGAACGGTNWALKCEQTAAELRRLHAANAELLNALRWIGDRCPSRYAGSPLNIMHLEMAHDAGMCARAAIAKHGSQQ